METAIAYVRVSDQRQVEDGASLETQTRLVTKYAESNGYDLVKVFREEGESAKTDQRPRLQELLSYCKDRSSRATVLIVPKIDRLARNTHDYATLKIQLSRLNIRIESIGEKIEDTPVGRFTETIMASVAQFDNEIRAERCKGGMLEAVQAGRWVWKAPLGYRNIRHNGKGTIEPDPATAPHIERAFELVGIGKQTPRQVMNYLKSHGIKLTRSTFYRMFTNEAYIGRIRSFGGVFEATPPFVPIVSESLFGKAQRGLEASVAPQTYQVEHEEFPLRGSIRCMCGNYFTASFSRSKTGKLHGYYRCMKCGSPSIKMDRVMELFEEELKQYEPTPGVMERVRACLESYVDGISKASRQAAKENRERISELQKLRSSIVLKNASGVIPDDVAKSEIDRLTGEIERLQQSVQAEPCSGDVTSIVGFAENFLTGLSSHWHYLKLQTKKNFLKLLFPQGVLFSPNDGFRTQDIVLLEQIKRVLSGDMSQLVHRPDEFSNLLLAWLEQLKMIEQDQRLVKIKDRRTARPRRI